MPDNTIVIKSTFTGGHIWEVTESHVWRGLNNRDGLGYDAGTGGRLDYYQRVTTVSTPTNALDVNYFLGTVTGGTHTEDYTTPPGTISNTLVDYPAGTGSDVSLVVPTFKPEWGSYLGAVYMITGNLTIQHIKDLEQLVIGTCKPGLPLSYVAPEMTPPTGQNWSASEQWAKYPPCPLNPLYWPLYNSHERYVARLSAAPCSPAYDAPFDLTGKTEVFRYWSESEAGFPKFADEVGAAARPGQDVSPFIFSREGGGTFETWIKAAQGTTKTLALAHKCAAGAGQGVSGLGYVFQYAPPFTIVERRLTHRYKVSFSDFQFQLKLRFANDTSSQEAERGVPDIHNGVALLVSATQPSAGKKRIFVTINPALTKNIGTGSGSKGGWQGYAYKEVDARSQFGALYLPNGQIVLTYEDWSSGSAVPVYSVHKGFAYKVGGDPANGWSAALPLTASAPAQILQAGRALSQGFAFRVE